MNGRKIDRTELFRTVDRKLAVPNADAWFPISCCNPTGTGMYKRLASTSSAQRTRNKTGYTPCAHQALCAPCRDAVPSASDGWCSERLLSSRRHGSAHIGSLGSAIFPRLPHRFCAIVDSSPPKGGIDALASEQATAVQPCRRA